MMLLKIIAACLTTVLTINAAPLGDATEDPRLWLFRYGYQTEYNPNITDTQLVESIKDMQKFAHLPVTGNLDKATLKQMKTPRCGLEDPYKKSNRKKRFTHQGSDWKAYFTKKGKKELKWTLKNNGRTIDRNTALLVMRRAFAIWEQKTDIDFTEVPYSCHEQNRLGCKEEDIEIFVSFGSYNHNDFYPFDGQGGTLAHAFYPNTHVGLSGDVHFDDSEEFTYGKSYGTDLLWVAVHELGHSLGLEHSNVKSAIMYPYYSRQRGPSLAYDDILGIQTLYGPRTSKVKTTTTTTTTTKAPIINYDRDCPAEITRTNGITAIEYFPNYGQHFAFSKSKVYLLGYKSRIPSMPVKSYYPKIDKSIDSVFTTNKLAGYVGKDHQVYFSASRYFIYKGFKYVSDHSIYDRSGPLQIAFPRTYNGEPIDKVDAVLTWFKNKKTYFFSGKYYWRYNNERRQFDADYPREIYGRWRGLPKKIDAAYSSETRKETFFVSGDDFYVYDDKKIAVKSRHSIKTFLKCNKAERINAAGAIGSIVENLKTIADP